MINATSGGALMDKTPVVARHLISNGEQHATIRDQRSHHETESENAEIIGSIGGYQYVREATVPTKSESRAVYGLEIWIRAKYADSELE
ncbi:hypothetical protein CR513_61185, partial [Mucuna pruriens]